MRLTDTRVQRARHPGGTEWFVIADAGMPGLLLRVYATGRKSWAIRYTTRDGRRVYMTLGIWPRLSLEEARAEARDKLREVDRGGDPKAERDALRGQASVEELTDEYMTRHAEPRKKTAEKDRRMIERHLLPIWKTRRAASITRAEVARLHGQVGKRNGPGAANRLLEVISTMWRLGEIWGHVPDGHRNPAVGVDRFPEQPRDRWLTEEEMGRLIAAIEEETIPKPRTEAERVQGVLFERGPMRLADLARAVDLDYYITASHVRSLVKQGRATKHPKRPGVYSATAVEGPRDIGPMVRAALWLYLLLGVRRGELLRARWDEIEWTPGREKLWLRGRKTKTGKPRAVTLPQTAVAILRELPRVEGNPYVLAGTKPGGRLGGLQPRWKAVRERAGLEDVWLHDLRRTVASSVAQSGANLLVLQHVLGHREIKTTMAYSYLGAEPDREALERHAAKVLTAAGRKPPARVTPMEEARRKRKKG